MKVKSARHASRLPGVPVPDEVGRRLARAVRLFAKWRYERDRLIIEAHEAGGSTREIAKLAEVSHPTVISIIRKAADTPGSVEQLDRTD